MGGGTPSPPRGYVRARAPMSNGFNSPWDASLDNAVRQFWPTNDDYTDVFLRANHRKAAAVNYQVARQTSPRMRVGPGC